MSTAPFDPAVATLVQESHSQWVTLAYSTDAGATWTDLALVDGTVGWAERRAPRVLADVEIADVDEDTIAALDPLAYVLGRFTVTYVLPDGRPDSQVVATLQLRVRGTRRPDGVLRLTFASIEAAIIDAASAASITTGNGTSPEVITVDPIDTLAVYLADYAFGPYDPLTVTVTAQTRPDVEAPYDQRPDGWAWLQGIADTADLDFYDPGDQTIVIADRPTVQAQSSARFAAGAGSTLLTSDSSVSREDWANQVNIAYLYDSATTEGVTYPDATFGVAKILDGPYSLTAAGWKLHYEEVQGKVSQATANKRAKNTLRVLSSRAHGLTFTAVPHWWLRPGATVTVQLPAADEARHLASEVEFSIAAQEMRVTTRRPDDTLITTSEE